MQLVPYLNMNLIVISNLHTHRAPVRACNSCYQRRNSKSKATCISNEELEQTIRNFQDNSSLCEDDDTDTQSQSGMISIDSNLH